MNARKPDVGIPNVTKLNAKALRITALSVTVLGFGQVSAAQKLSIDLADRFDDLAHPMVIGQIFARPAVVALRNVVHLRPLSGVAH